MKFTISNQIPQHEVVAPGAFDGNVGNTFTVNGPEGPLFEALCTNVAVDDEYVHLSFDTLEYDVPLWIDDVLTS